MSSGNWGVHDWGQQAEAGQQTATNTPPVPSPSEVLRTAAERRYDNVVVPKVGQVVVYAPRPGEGRMGRIRFPALVMQADEATGAADLMVFFAADDVINLQRVPPHSEQNLAGWIPASGGIGFDPIPLLRELDEVRSSRDEIVRQVFGDYAAPEGSLIGYVSKLYSRVEALEKVVLQRATPKVPKEKAAKRAATKPAPAAAKAKKKAKPAGKTPKE